MFSVRFESENLAPLCSFTISAIPIQTLQNLLHTHANTAFSFWKMKLMQCSPMWWAAYADGQEMRSSFPSTKCCPSVKEAFFCLTSSSPKAYEHRLRRASSPVNCFHSGNTIFIALLL